MSTFFKQKFKLLTLIVFLVSLYLLPVSGYAEEIVAYRGTFLDMVGDPWATENQQETARFVQDGLLVVEDGKIKDFGEYEALKGKYPNVEFVTFEDRLIVPGFIDGHIHFPQTRVVGAYGEHLLDWLEESIYPEERKYEDPEYAKEGAKKFFDNLLANGTTTVQSFTTTSNESVEAFFNEATKRNMRVIAGYTGIDVNAPKYIEDTPEKFYKLSKKNIEKYHMKGRNLYAISPRFAFGSDKKELEMAQKLKEECKSCWVNTHLAETPNEYWGVEILYPDATDYLAVFEEFDLVGPKFSGGHSIYMSDDAFKRLSEAGGAAVFCPASNLFLGSGLFRLGKATDPEQRVRLALGTDMAGGNYFSLLQVLSEAYKVGMLNNLLLEGDLDPRQKNLKEAERNKISAYRGLYLLTLGGAHALYLDEWIGNFEPGKEADFVVLDLDSGPVEMPWHQSLYGGPGAPKTKENAAKKLFSLMALGDDRNIDKTYIAGKLAYEKKQ